MLTQDGVTPLTLTLPPPIDTFSTRPKSTINRQSCSSNHGSFVTQQVQHSLTHLFLLCRNKEINMFPLSRHIPPRPVINLFHVGTNVFNQPRYLYYKDFNNSWWPAKCACYFTWIPQLLIEQMYQSYGINYADSLPTHTHLPPALAYYIINSLPYLQISPVVFCSTLGLI